jgi:hypothetical protein
MKSFMISVSHKVILACVKYVINPNLEVKSSRKLHIAFQLPFTTRPDLQIGICHWLLIKDKLGTAQTTHARDEKCYRVLAYNARTR